MEKKQITKELIQEVKSQINLQKEKNDEIDGKSKRKRTKKEENTGKMRDIEAQILMMKQKIEKQQEVFAQVKNDKY